MSEAALTIPSSTEPFDQVAPARNSYRSQDELDIRVAVDIWGRSRWPDARVVHELVMDRGKVRCDMAFIGPRHLVSIEIKSGYDVAERLMNQVTMFRLATPETWIVVDHKHLRDTRMIAYLLPSIGIAVAERSRPRDVQSPFRITVEQEHSPFVAQPEAMLHLLWTTELRDEAVRFRLPFGKRDTHAKLVKNLLARLTAAEQIEAVCRQLRARNALWRADPPVEIKA